MKNNPKAILANSPMNSFQITAVCICIFLNALDGFDVLAISFASPGIAADWDINRAELGIVLSMELIGMAVGSMFLGGVADKIGRRPTILGCLIVMTAGMYLAALADSIGNLLVVRFITGLGIGGMLAAINAMAAEYSNKKSKNLCVILMAAGYPLGAIFGGAVASMLLVSFDWRAVFIFGALVTGVALIIVYFLLPESIEYLVDKRPANALEKINKTLGRMGHQQIDELPPQEQHEGAAESGYRQLFSKGLLSVTIVLTFAYFFHIMSFYYIIKWIPKIVVDMGFAASTAGGVLVWANVGGALGAAIIGVLATKLDLRKLIMSVMFVGFIMICVFGLGQETIVQLALISAIAGFFNNAAVVGLYALLAQYFPASVRASGTGFVIGLGRGGAALGPMIAGFLFASGFDLFPVSVAMGMGACLAAITLMFLRKHEEPVSASSSGVVAEQRG